MAAAIYSLYPDEESENKIRNEKACKSKALEDSIPGDLVNNDGWLTRVPQTEGSSGLD